jgi:hypothetical protein
MQLPRWLVSRGAWVGRGEGRRERLVYSDYLKNRMVGKVPSNQSARWGYRPKERPDTKEHNEDCRTMSHPVLDARRSREERGERGEGRGYFCVRLSGHSCHKYRGLISRLPQPQAAKAEPIIWVSAGACNAIAGKKSGKQEFNINSHTLSVPCSACSPPRTSPN